MIVGLFPELSSTGGIQRSGVLTALALASFASWRGESCRLLSLNDRAGGNSSKAGGREIRLTGCGGSKARLASSALTLAIRQPTIVLALHPNLARVVAAMKVVAPGMRSVVVVHGVEVWEPLPLITRLSLQSADRVLAPSEYTLSCATREQRLLIGKG